MINGSAKLGRPRTGAELIAYFKESNAAWACSVHTKASCFSKAVKGAAIAA
jgi:hypothetical protein